MPTVAAHVAITTITEPDVNVVIDGVLYVPVIPKAVDGTVIDALEIRFDSDAGDDITIRDYLHTLLETLWTEGEGFSGKRPFGNSCWEFELYEPLIKAGFITGSLDEDGHIAEFAREEAEAYVFELIRAAFYGVSE
jgi:hypothetical protein